MSFNIIMIMLSILTIMACATFSIVTLWKLRLVVVFAGVPPMILGDYI